MSFYVDKNGVIVAETAGLGPKDEIEAHIKKTIASGGTVTCWCGEWCADGCGEACWQRVCNEAAWVGAGWCAGWRGGVLIAQQISGLDAPAQGSGVCVV